MALDIHEFNNAKMGELLFQIDDQTYATLYPAFELFLVRTGQSIDPYRDLVVDRSLNILITAITETTKQEELLSILKRCAKKEQPIIFVGD